ncbi:MAG TPA: CRTAC1 family protein [Thermoanaerobaculia bacterium]
MRRAFGVAPGLAAAALAGWVFLAAAPEKKTLAPKKPSPDAGCPVVFTDVAVQAGLRFVHERGATPNHQLPETMGSGLAWLDYDNDGWMDLYVVQSGPFPASGAARVKNRLFHNNHDGTFTDVTEKAGLKDASYGMGVVAADYDNDGYVDLFVTNFGGNTLYHNNGDGTFTDVTEKAGVKGSGWSTSAAFADFDGDGNLDLFVVRYLDYSVEKNYFCGDPVSGRRDYCHPSLYPPISNLMFHNNGDGTFTDVTESSGISKALGKGLGVVVADFDDDGRPDIYVANDTTMNFLFHNLGGMKFEDASLISGAGVNSAGRAFGGMGTNAGDLDGDGKLDIVVANFEAEPNSFYRNLGELVFEDASSSSGFGPPHFNFSGFGLNLLDAANAGHLDAFIANGHVLEVPKMQGVTYAERPFLMWNDGHGKFTERGCGAPFRRELVGRGSATADYDNDGDIDVAVSNSGGPLQLLRNDGRHGGWIGFLLRGHKSNRQGIGARLTLETEQGRQVRDVKAGDSYLSSSDPRVHFGLGTVTKIKRLEIRWPSGIVQSLDNPAIGRYHTIEEPEK